MANKNYIVKNVRGHYEFFELGSSTPFMSCDHNELKDTIKEIDSERE